jgi:hypothetical protein
LGVSGAEESCEAQESLDMHGWGRCEEVIGGKVEMSRPESGGSSAVGSGADAGRTWVDTIAEEELAS